MSSLSSRKPGRKIDDPLADVSAVNGSANGNGKLPQQNDIACGDCGKGDGGGAYYSTAPMDLFFAKPDGKSGAVVTADQQQQQQQPTITLDKQTVANAYTQHNSVIHTKQAVLRWVFCPSELLDEKCQPKTNFSRKQIEELFRVYPINQQRGSYTGPRVGNLDSAAMLSIEAQMCDNGLGQPLYVVSPTLQGKVHKHNGRCGRGAKGKALCILPSAPAVYKNGLTVYKRREIAHLLPLANAYAGVDLKNIDVGIIDLPLLPPDQRTERYVHECVIPPTSFILQMLRNQKHLWGLEVNDLPTYENTSCKKLPVKVKNMLLDAFRLMVEQLPRDNFYDLAFLLEAVAPELLREMCGPEAKRKVCVAMLVTFRYMFTSDTSICV